MADYVILVLGSILIVVTIPLTAIVTAYKGKQSKLKLELLKHEIELEKLRKDTYFIETEKLRLEIEKTRQQLFLNQPIRSQIKEEISDK